MILSRVVHANSQQIWHRGIEPDVAVSLSADASILQLGSERDLDRAGPMASKDVQLLKGLDAKR